MTCPSADELALFVGGDLSSARSGRVEHHLATCPACADTARELRDTVIELNDSPNDVIDASHLLDVRRRVLQNIADLESPGFVLRVERALFAGVRSRYALAGAAAVLLIGVVSGAVLWHVRTPSASTSVGARGPAAAQPAMPVIASVEPTSDAKTVVQPKPATRQRRAPRRPAETQPAQGQPKELLVKLFTDDPNIVVYWFVEQNGAMQ
jgi:anti-sigma factor RsiW